MNTVALFISNLGYILTIKPISLKNMANNLIL